MGNTYDDAIGRLIQLTREGAVTWKPAGGGTSALRGRFRDWTLHLIEESGRMRLYAGDGERPIWEFPDCERTRELHFTAAANTEPMRAVLEALFAGEPGRPPRGVS